MTDTVPAKDFVKLAENYAIVIDSALTIDSGYRALLHALGLSLDELTPDAAALMRDWRRGTRELQAQVCEYNARMRTLLDERQTT